MGEDVTNREQVLEAVRVLGAATNPQVCSELQGRLTPRQVSNALREATSVGQLVTTRRPIPGSFLIETTYRIKPPVRVLRYPSVWHYGQGVTV
jgi:hypothetical protein